MLSKQPEIEQVESKNVLAKAGLAQMKKPPKKEEFKKNVREENAKNYLKSAARHTLSKLGRASSAVKPEETKQ